jgi:hypothetical protein
VYPPFTTLSGWRTVPRSDRRCHILPGKPADNAPFGLNLDLQRQILNLILNEFVENGDLTNQVLEVDLKKNGEVQLRRIALPAE